jgi:hypothetical protein
MTVPDDEDRVLTAIRLGWTIAEVRGRNRPDPPPAAKAVLPGPGRALPLHVEQTPTELRIEAQSVLGAMARRLRLERGKNQGDFPAAIDAQAKRLYEARKAAAAGAVPAAGGPAPNGASAGQAAPGGPASGEPRSGEAPSGGPAVPAGAVPGDPAIPAGAAPGPVAPGGPAAPAGAEPGETAPGETAPGEMAPREMEPGETAPGGRGSLTEQLLARLQRLSPAGQQVVHPPAGATAAAAPGDPAAEWVSLQELIFRFDEHIQDTLASGPDTVACGYQLGRALAEPYWALAPGLPDKTPSAEAWWFLLGPERCGEMSRLAGRLTAYFHTLTAAAIAGSVQIWKHVAADPAWRAHAEDHLYLQVRRWYELVIMKQDPTTLVRPGALIRNFRMMFRVLRIFWPELVGAVIAAAALSGFAVALGENNISSFAKSALGFIAITGFSVAGLTAKLKNQAQAMVTRLRQDVYTDLVAVAITTAPPDPSTPNRPSRQNSKKARLARERTITPVTPN